MRVHLATDHAGFELKNSIKTYLIDKGYDVHGLKRRSSSLNTARIDHLYQDPNTDEQIWGSEHGLLRFKRIKSFSEEISEEWLNSKN